MKIIFLDIDGVLNTERYILSCVEAAKSMNLRSEIFDEYGHKFCPVSVNHLIRIIKETDAKIVISSTWRHDGLQKMKEMWSYRSLPGEVIDITPSARKLPCYDQIKDQSFDMKCERGREIDAWLNTHDDVESYVIFDDDSDMFDFQKPFFIQTDPQTGIDRAQADRAISILNGRPYRDSGEAQRWLMDTKDIRVFVSQKVAGDFGFEIYTPNPSPDARAGLPWIRHSFSTKHFSTYDDALQSGVSEGMKFVESAH